MDERDIEQLRRAAESGDANAMVNLSLAYMKGEGVEKDLEQEIHWTRKAAEAGHAVAMFNFSLAYMKGRGVEKDLEQEIHWTRKAADAGHAGAMFNLGLAHIDGKGAVKDLEAGFLWVQKAADAGHVGAMYTLSTAYMYGNRVEKNVETGIHWTRKAAEAGHADSMFNLGLAYANGEGVEKDSVQYIYWTRKAAEAGYVVAMFNLGLAYMDGEGVEKDLEQYIYWTRKAADAGNAVAMGSLSLAYMNGEGVEKDLEQYIYWIRKAAEAGNAVAMFNLSLAYMKGKGVKKDLEQEIYWTRKAAGAGQPDAMFNLSVAYIDGKKVDINVKEASMWIKKAVNKNHAWSIAPAMLIEFFEDRKITDDDMLSSFLSSIIDISIGINDIYNGPHLPNETESIYHYTDMESLQSMLNDDDNNNSSDGRSNFLRLYSPVHFNDPEEGNLFVEAESFIRYFYSEERKAKEDSNDKGIYPHAISSGGKDFSFYICSFSGEEDRLDLWRAYGRNGKGYSVSLKISSRLSSKKNDGHMIIGAIKSEFSGHDSDAIFRSSKRPKKIERVFMRKVLYGEKSVKEAFGYNEETGLYNGGSVGHNLKDLMEKLDEEGFNPDMRLLIKKIVRHMLGDLRYLYKSKEYNSEHEYRIVNLIDSSKFEIGIDRSKNPPRLYVETLPILFEDEGGKIIIGPNVFDKDAVAAYLNHLIALNGWKNTTTVEKSKIPYK